MDGTFKALLKTFLLSENAAEKIKLILNLVMLFLMCDYWVQGTVLTCIYICVAYVKYIIYYYFSIIGQLLASNLS